MAKIICQHRYCRYWEDNSCICDEIEIQFGGICSSQMLVNIDDDALEKLRKKDLKAEAEYWAEIEGR